MIFISDARGTITAVMAEPLNQGANNINTLVLIAPFPAENAVSAAFTLPNGQHIGPTLGTKMTNLNSFSGKFSDANGAVYNAWSLTPKFPILARPGDVSVQFFISSAHGTRPTSMNSFRVNRGIPVVQTSAPSSENWNLVLEAIAAANSAAGDAQAEAEKAAAEVEKAKEEVKHAKAEATKAADSANSARNYASNSQSSSDTAKNHANSAYEHRTYTAEMLSESGLRASTGLEYTLSEDSTYYSVSIGLATDEDIVIACVVEGLPVRIIPQSAFANSAIRSVKIPHTVVEIETSAFENCKNLESIHIPNSVRKVGEGAFRGCSALKYIRLGDTFAMDAPASTKDNAIHKLIAPVIYLADDALYINDASGVASSFEIIANGDVVATVQNAGIDTSISLDNLALENGKYLFTVRAIASGYTDSDESNEISYVIGGMTELLYTLSDDGKYYTVSGVARVGGNTDVIVPATYNGLPVQTVGRSAFSGMGWIRSVALPASVKSIGRYAFSSCVNMREISIPNTVSSIAICAFTHCDSLRNVYYGGTEDEWNAISVAENNDNLLGTTIYFSTVMMTINGEYFITSDEMLFNVKE